MAEQDQIQSTAKRTFSAFLEESQRTLIRNSWPEWVDVYRICNCNYIETNLPADRDEFHAEMCDARTLWQWEPISDQDMTGAYTTIFCSPVHYYHRSAGQTSLRCSYCADAPRAAVHEFCHVDGCFELADSPTNPYCPDHEWEEFAKPIPLLADDVCRVCFHDAHERTCIAIDPADINPHNTECGCREYVDLEAESRIVVHVEHDPDPEPKEWSENW